MRIFIAMLAFAGLFANASDMKDAAYKAVENSRAQLEDFRKSRVEKISQKKSELDALSKEIRELRELEETLTASIAERASLSSAAAFCDSRAGELAADMRDFKTSFFPELQAVAARSSASESLEIIRREGDSWLKSLFNPLEPRPFAAVPISSREKVDGKIFRVGAFAYFISPERAGFVDSEGVLYGENFARDIRDFAGGKKNSLPADISAGTIFSAEKNARSIAEEISLGGIWMYPILLLGFLSALVFLIKLAYFMRVRRAPEGVAGKIKQALAKGGESAALGIAAASGYPYSRLLADLIESRNLSQAALEEVSYESMLSAGEKLFSGLSVLSVSAAVAPLLGLLGTVTGIIKTFGDLSFSGAGQAEFISAGISEALITTEYGLVVAIPAYVAHAIFSRRAKSVLSDMEKIASSYLSGNYMEDFFKAFCETFQAGGLLMVPLAVLAFYLYYSGVGVCIRLSKIKRVCDSDELFDAALKSFITSRELPHDAKKIFPRLRMELMGGVDRRILFLKVLSSVAPLIGLLGTVSGMCAIIASAGENPQGVADGISVALITTQAGLVVAIPSWIIAICASALASKILAILSRRESQMIRSEVAA